MLSIMSWLSAGMFGWKALRLSSPIMRIPSDWYALMAAAGSMLAPEVAAESPSSA
jgi:hypothetical protein